MISETNNLQDSSFFSKYCKFYLDYGNAEENAENIFLSLRELHLNALR